MHDTCAQRLGTPFPGKIIILQERVDGRKEAAQNFDIVVNFLYKVSFIHFGTFQKKHNSVW